MQRSLGDGHLYDHGIELGYGGAQVLHDTQKEVELHRSQSWADKHQMASH